METSDRVRLFTKISGSGPVCIFIHGGLGAWSRSFEELRGNNLEKRLTMVYYDQRGCGRSGSSEQDNYTLDRMVEDIEEIRQSLNIQKVFLVSHSFGGVLAFNYVKKYPQQVKGLALTNATLYLSNSIEEQINYINELMDTDFKVNGKESLHTVYTQAQKATGDLSYKALSDYKEVEEAVRKIDQSYPRNMAFSQHFWDSANEAFLNDYTVDTPQVQVPTLVVAGAKDHANGVNHYKLFKFPNQQTVVIDGGHMLYYDKNEAFCEAIFSFVDTTEQGLEDRLSE